MAKILFTLLILIFLFNQTSAQPSDKQLVKRIEKLVSENYQSIAPGCAVLVAIKDKVSFEKAFGLANLELNVPLKPEMVFRIGSITKQYTAIAILKLMEEGKLSLKDRIQRFLPQFPFKEYTINIENLLTHTSGLIDYQVFDSHIPNAIRVDLPSNVFLDSLAGRLLEFKPGAKYAYSNSNYFILGMIIEKITGKKYQAYLEDSILKPNGLINTFYDIPWKIIPGRVSGYSGESLKYNNAGYISMNHVFSAGALLSNVKDLYNWHNALLSYSTITKETLDKAWTSYRLLDSTLAGYGYGWFDGTFQGMKAIWHGGAIDGFRAMACYFPEQNIFLAVLINSESSNIFSLVEKLTALFAKPSDAVKEITLADSVLQNYTGTYRWMEDTTQTITIYKKGNRLYADLSNKTGMNMSLIPQTAQLFYLPDVRRIRTTIEFVLENGVVRELIWTQEKSTVLLKLSRQTRSIRIFGESPPINLLNPPILFINRYRYSISIHSRHQLLIFY
jgi:CubicO group peptidase (beta-lactamase class C family)